MAAGIAIAASDNAAFLTDAWRMGGGPLFLTASEREMFRWIDEHRLGGILYTPNGLVSYLSATYTPVRPFYGHPFNTPRYAHRREIGNRFLETCRMDPSMATIDYFLLHKDVLSRCLLDRDWQRLHENADLVLLARREVR
jgi:hypothetical protein